MHNKSNSAYEPPQKREKKDKADSQHKSHTMASKITKAGDWSLAISTDKTCQRSPQKGDMQEDSDDEKWRASNRQKFASGKRYVILGTASIRIQIGTHITPTFRAICDTGAQAGLITVAAVKRNALPLKQCARTTMNGVGGSSSLDRKLQAHILPWFDSDYRLYTELFVNTQFGGDQPWVSLTTLKTGTDQLTLADPNFYHPAPIDILLGGDVWSEIIGSILYKHVTGAVMHETRLGYVILGQTWVPQEAFESSVFLHETTLPDQSEPQEQALDKLLKAFFRSEDIPEANSGLTKEEEMVEEMYAKTVYRKPDGSYVTRIPFKPNKALGESRKIVMRRFLALERRLQKDQALKDKYIEFMREFIRLGHMREAPQIKPESMAYYIPHHAISAEKFRSVFDASSKTTNGESLNSIQMKGPKLQLDIHFHLMRFRRFKYAVVSDVVKMFRQVGIDPSQWDLQRIFWREAPNQPLKEYQITVVIYGLTSSLHAAVRTMIQCAKQYEAQYPHAAEIIQKCFYVDDASFGEETEARLKTLCKEVEWVLKQGGFELSKWASNSREVESYMRADISEDVELGKAVDLTKVLGLRWLKKSDEIAIIVKQPTGKVTDSKRKILSEIAKLFDPNGFVAPVVVVAKMLMRDIWCEKNLPWDKGVPEAIGKRWVEFVSSLNGLSEYRIPRWLSTDKQSTIQLHGFCDASGKALGATIYVRVCKANKEIISTLLVAKSRVAKLNESTIPRMELQSALLCSKLMSQAAAACEYTSVQKYLWSDSTIALSWIKRSPLQLKTFVANRVQAIHEYTQGSTWSHVATTDNPADLVSRGMKVPDFVKSDLWKHGPNWLSKPQAEWPYSKLVITSDIQAEITRETKTRNTTIFAVMILSVQDQFRELWHRSNSWRKILRMTAYVFRFFTNVRMKNRQGWIRGEPKPAELKDAIIFWVKYAQLRAYKKELEALKQKDQCAYLKSKIIALQPFIDEIGILRIGGRIDKANVDLAKKHPIIVPPKSRLSYLIINQAHQETMHGSIQIMMAYIRRLYWIPALRSECRKITSQCAKCVRYNKKVAQQIMAELPAVRLRPAKPFEAVGADLAGPFNVKVTDKLNLSTRSRATIPEIKGYAAVFVCMVTRAVHMEAVMDLSSDAFLQAYKRFVSRRGNPEKIFSDNGTNFVAADKALSEAAKSWQNSTVQQYAGWNGSHWHFITPGAPHEGGLWEAAVKSMKHHFRRVIGAQKYSYEGMSTLIACIEACLNSRPLCALSDDPKDIEALTPAHFIIGGPLKLPLPEKCDKPPQTANGLFKAIQAQTQAFWQAWSNDCLHAMMNRTKWREEQRNLKQGQLVLIKNENLAPTYWAMGRIIEVRPAEDNKVRSVKIKMQNGILERSIRKLCVLPTDECLNFWVEN